jgi:hypothetical protein
MGSRIKKLPETAKTREYGDEIGVVYRVVELSVVTAEEIESALNATVREGWVFDSIHFAMWEGSRRPSMAFLLFVRKESSER